MDVYQSYIHKSRYARYLPDEQRRETWDETVDRDNVAGFNCSYMPIDHPKAFDEMMYVLMCGTGAGFSVERQYINKLPEVSEDFHDTETIIHVADSKIGWAKAYRELITMLYSGQLPKWDLSRVRASGEPLKTFGGRASGPEPLEDLFRFTVEVFRSAAGRKLSSIECHDICCKIAQIVIVGGVRRSALISLSNLTDDRVRRAKTGQWWLDNPQRGLANNSACYTEKPDFEAFINEWVSLYESRSGERGFFSRVASQRQAEKNGRRDASYDFGTNPCSEIILRPNQFCNLSEVVVRSNDTVESLKRKVRLASILGTLQATLTDFRYLRSKWKQNTEEEALLGVSMTGIQDCKLTNGAKNGLPELLEDLKAEAVITNKSWAQKLGINQATAITCVKPSGTVSQLVNSASGIHGRFAPYYIRRVRADINDPLCGVLNNAGIASEVDNRSPSTLVFSFPQKAPRGAVMSASQTGMEQLELWDVYQKHWCEHKPSVTVYYRDSEFLDIGSWMYNNFDTCSGVSFLPFSEHSYEQAPYEEITRDQYEKLAKEMPKGIEWDITEQSDTTEGAQTLACVGGACEI